MKRAFFTLMLVGLAVILIYPLTTYSYNAEPKVIQVHMNEFHFEPESIIIKSGQVVKIELINDGKIAHEFMIGHTVKTEHEEHTASGSVHDNSSDMKHGDHNKMKESGMSMTHAGTSKGFEYDFFKGIEIKHSVEGGKFLVMPDHGTMTLLQPGGKATLTFKVPDSRKGEWEIACFQPGHYEAGMKGKFIVK